VSTPRLRLRPLLPPLLHALDKRRRAGRIPWPEGSRKTPTREGDTPFRTQVAPLAQLGPPDYMPEFHMLACLYLATWESRRYALQCMYTTQEESSFAHAAR
jgi:hypothetical protein